MTPKFQFRPAALLVAIAAGAVALGMGRAFGCEHSAAVFVGTVYATVCLFWLIVYLGGRNRSA
jgi:hypothetical protein